MCSYVRACVWLLMEAMVELFGPIIYMRVLVCVCVFVCEYACLCVHVCEEIVASASSQRTSSSNKRFKNARPNVTESGG